MKKRKIYPKEFKARFNRPGEKLVCRLMREMNLLAIYPKPNLSKPHPEHKIYPYLLRKLDIIRANQVWATDITYVPLRRGVCYLVAVMDWFSRKEYFEFYNTERLHQFWIWLKMSLMLSEKLRRFFKHEKIQQNSLSRTEAL